MEENLSGKKLLILGANPETSQLVKYANDMGIKTLVTSNCSTDDAKKYAWKSFDIDGMNVPEIITLARKENVDGVLVGVADVLVPAYCKVCDALGFHCYATQEIVKVFSYKDIFKSTCERYGIHGIPEYYLDAEMKRKDLDKIEYPVMVKPVDSCSGKGMTVCYGEKNLASAVEKALSESREKRFIVEKYMQCDDIGIYYTFRDGVCSASCVFDRYTTSEQDGVSRVCLGATYPSKYIKQYFERIHENMCRMFKAIGIKNGVLLIQAFYENGEFYVYDTGFRFQGEASHLLIKAIHGFDQREMLIRFALTGSEGSINLSEQDDPYFRGKYAATLWFLLKKGTIHQIKGVEHILEDSRIVDSVQRLSENDEVLDEWIGTEKQVMSRLYFVCNSKKELSEALLEYIKKVEVVDTDGKDMLLSGFDVKKALEFIDNE